MLDLLHLADSSFPTGAYAHSAGLETLALRTSSELERHLQLRVRESLGRFELVFLLHAYHDELVGLDARYHTMVLPREVREASSQVGTQLLRAACDLFAGARLHEFLVDGAHHHHPIVFGAVAAALEVPPMDAAGAYALQSTRALISVAQRIQRLGQRDAQRVLHGLKPDIRAAVDTASGLRLEEAGAFTPIWDLASMAHERAPARLFAS
jgi:urease accessory protein